MSAPRTFMAVALVGLCCLSSVFATYLISCYTCDSVDACKNPKKQGCNTQLGNETTAYLDFHYENVNKTVQDFSYNCFADYLKDANFTVQYKGCVYNNVKTCALVPRENIHPLESLERRCMQCDFDYCNPAARANSNIFLTAVAFVMAAIARQAISN